jgi:hypothetical protein
MGIFMPLEILGISLAVLDNDFNIKDTFEPILSKLPFKRLFPSYLYKGYLMVNGEMAATSWGYYYPQCKVKIFDVKTKKSKVTLTWDHPFPPTQQDVDGKRNIYSSFWITKCKDYYFIQTDYFKNTNSKCKHKLLIFNSNGTYITKIQLPTYLIRSYEKKAKKIYLIDENENLIYWDIDLL